MPSHRIDQSTIFVGAFDVVGQDTASQGFIGHSGLAESAGKQFADAIAVIDVKPPLRQSSDMRADVVGSANLTSDEAAMVKTFIDRNWAEHQGFAQLTGGRLLQVLPSLYCIFPHMHRFCEPDGRYARTRFSCAGFVFEAYRFAHIRLLDEKVLPEVDMDAIRSAYPQESRLMDLRPETREKLGLTGNGPWQVMLCGYLFHALNRDAEVIRQTVYRPRRGDEIFDR